MGKYYASSDLEETLDSLELRELSVSRLRSTISGPDFLEGLKASIYGVFNGDPDNVWGLLSLAVEDLLLDVTTILDGLSAVSGLLEASVADVSKLRTQDVRVITAALDAARYQSREATAKELTRVERRINNISATMLPPSKAYNTTFKDPARAKADVANYLVEIRRALSAFQEKINKVNYVLVNYGLAEGYKYAVSAQANLVINALNDLLRQGGGAAPTTLFTASASLGLLEEKLYARDPMLSKYDGTVTYLDGVAAFKTSGESLPIWTAGITEAIVVDGVNGNVVVASATPAVLTVHPAATLSGAPIYPYLAPLSVSILVDNIECTEYSAVDITNLAGLVSLITTAVGANAVVTSDSVSNSITITSVSLGSSARVSLYNNSQEAGLDVNSDFGLTHSTYGVVKGADTALDGVTTTHVGITPALTSARVIVVEGLNVTPVDVAGDIQVTIPTTYVALARDAAVIDGSYYRLSDVTGSTVTLTPDVLLPFNGVTLGPYVSAAVSVYREYLTVSSPVASYTSSTVEKPAGPNTLLFPSTAIAYSFHDRFTFDDDVYNGSPIRINDVICAATPPTVRDSRVRRDPSDPTKVVAQTSPDGAVLGSVLGSLTGSVVFEGGYANELSNGLRVYPLGAWNYRALVHLLKPLENAFLQLPSIDSLIRKVQMFISSQTDRYLINEDLVKYLTYFTSVSTALDAYAATVPEGITTLFKVLKEGALTVVTSMLMRLDFIGVFNITPAQLSSSEYVSTGFEQAASYLGKPDSIVELRRSAAVFELTDDEIYGEVKP